MPSSRYIFGGLAWYSVLVLSGVIAAILLCARETKRRGLPDDTTVDLALLTVPLGIIGARLYYVIFSWSDFAGDPLQILRIWEGGLAIYGGVIGGALAVFIYSRAKKLPLAVLCDCIAPGLVLAQSIGRWGNFFNMEAYGLPITAQGLQFFPLGVYIPDSGWHMATFFYESMWDLTVFIILWRTRTKHLRDGDGLLWYLLLYGSGRLVIEGLRMDSLMSPAGGIRVSQLLSLLLLLVACALLSLPHLRRLTPLRRGMWICLMACALGLGGIMLMSGGVLLRSLLGAGAGLCCCGGAVICRRGLRSRTPISMQPNP